VWQSQAHHFCAGLQMRGGEKEKKEKEKSWTKKTDHTPKNKKRKGNFGGVVFFFFFFFLFFTFSLFSFSFTPSLPLHPPETMVSGLPSSCLFSGLEFHFDSWFLVSIHLKVL